MSVYFFRIPVFEKPANVCEFDSKNDYKLECFVITPKLFLTD